jgi:2-oxoisovalerate dehydrogenase E2 component (dihydrolipoyl transacylase)
MKTFTLPDLGEGLPEAEIVSWHVNAGDRVVEDQPLLSVETDKAVVDIPAPWSGHVVELIASPGDIVATGTPLARFDIEGGGDDAGAIVGKLPQAEPAEAGVLVRTVEAASRRAKAVPAARRKAADLGVALGDFTGSGPGGVITVEDVETAAGAGQRGAREGWETLRGVRRAMARNMARAHAEVVPATVTEEAVLANQPAAHNVTVALIRAVGAACLAEPALNAWYDDKAGARRLHDRLDLGIAVNTEEGLFVPVLRDVTNRTREDLAAALEAIKRDTAVRSIPRADLEGQTMTLSNFGSIGGRHAALVVMPPQVAILGAGRIRQEARVIGEEIEAASVLPLSLTFDHRAVTGIEATRFLMAVVAHLESQDDQ